MTKKKSDLVKVKFLRDGVYPFDDVRKDTGDTAEVPESVAKAFEVSGDAKRV